MEYALIFAGGTGARMHMNALPKQFLEVYGKPIIAYTIEHFQHHSNIEKILIVCVETHIELMWNIIKKNEFYKVLDVIPGGSSGQESIWNGLSYLNKIAKNDDIVLIHDGVRPNIDERLITENIKAVKKFGSAISAAPSYETICMAGNSCTIDKIYTRSQCLVAKAPQSFWLKDIIASHIKAKKEKKREFIDSASLMMYYGYNLHYVLCDNSNIKITTPYDYYIFKSLQKLKENMKIIGAVYSYEKNLV